MSRQITGKQMQQRLNNSLVDFCENAEEGGLDPGRYFIHIRTTHTFNEGNGDQSTTSVGSIKEAKQKLCNVTVRTQ